jgi:hypothetical protein
LQGEPLPRPPQWNKAWTVEQYQNEMKRYLFDLHDYLRRLMGKFTATNIFNEIFVIDPPPTLNFTFLSNWQYDASSHKFQVKTKTMKGVESAWTDAGGDQPVVISKSITDVTYSTSTHKFEEDSYANVYVLELGSLTSGEDIVELEPCT